MGRVSLRDLALALGIVLLAAIVGWQTTRISGDAIYAKVGPTVFPWIVTGMLAVLGILLTLNALAGGWSQDEESGELDLPSFGYLLAGLLANVMLIDIAGFILASTIMFVLTARAFGSKALVRDTAIGFILAFVSYVGFDRVLGYQIGSGLIESLL